MRVQLSGAGGCLVVLAAVLFLVLFIADSVMGVGPRATLPATSR